MGNRSNKIMPIDPVEKTPLIKKQEQVKTEPTEKTKMVKSIIVKPKINI